MSGAKTRKEREPMPDRPTPRSFAASVVRTFCALVVPWLVVGCASFQQAPQESPSLHVLQPGALPAKAPRRSDVTLEVSVPRATPGFDTPRIAYVERPYAIDYYSRSEWADTPARMLGPLVAAALEQSGAFRAVVLAPTSAQAELRVDVELLRLQQDFTIRPSRADLALRVQVVDSRARRVLATLVVEETEPAATQDAYGGVAATNAALKRALERTVAFVLGEAAAIRPTGP
jgi:cholesterol transport system auxiliary component